MDAASLLVGLTLGVLLGALGAALAAARRSTVLREQLARALAEEQARQGTEARLTETFSHLSRQALDANRATFFDQVQPIAAKLKDFEDKLGALQIARANADAEIRQQVESMGRSNERLRLETAGLKEALRGPISRGRWGEIHLRRVAELSGMTAHCDFVEQATLVGESGAQRPDMIVRLPGGKSLVVDAKVPLRAFLDAQETVDDAERERRMAEHAKLVRDHVTVLSRKAYAEQLDATPEFVVMFVPGEAFFSSAVQRDSELLEFGFSRGVIPASPTNLIALLKTVHYAWQQEKVAENAERIRDLAVELHDRLGTMTGHFRDLGGQLGKAVESYNAAIASLQSRVLVPGRKLKEMGAGGSRELPDPAVIGAEPTGFSTES